MKKLISIAEVAQRLGIHKASIHRMLGRGEFVAPIQVSPRRVAFDEGEVDAWVASRPRGALQRPAHLSASDLV